MATLIRLMSTDIISAQVWLICAARRFLDATREDTLVAVVPRGHALAQYRRISFRDTLNYDFIGLSDGTALQDFLVSHAAQAGRRLRLRIQLRSFDGICRMVESHAGIAIVPASAALRLRQIRAIRIIPLPDAGALRRLTLRVRSLADLPIHAARLVDHLRKT